MITQRPSAGVGPAPPFLMSRVLVLFAHPALEKSRVHRRLLHVARGARGVSVQDLYEEYPDFDVDVRREQALLLEHDVILFQFPVYWYSAPALVKQWEDLVLEHGWAYGSGGRQLEGKRMGVAVTTGGRAAAYTAQGLNRFTMDDFLRPIEQTAVLCRMRWLPPYLIQGTHLMDAAAIDEHAQAYRTHLESLAADGTTHGSGHGAAYVG